MYGSKIKAFRMMRGLSQEYLAEKLSISQATYSKIESENQKVTAEMLEKIAKLLGITVADITSNEPIVILNNAANQGTQGIGYIEHFYSDQKELYEKVIAAKDDEIKSLKEMIQSLRELINSFTQKKHN